MRSIIGITGSFGSGKSTAANILAKRGYKTIHLSSFLENEAMRRNLPLTRKILQDLGDEIRMSEGSGILLEKALQEFKDEEKIVIDGLRNLGEVEILKKKGGTLLAIVADRNIRFQRLKRLKRREKLDKDLFKSLDLRDLGVGEKISGLQTAFCIALADVYIDSNSTKVDLEKKVIEFLKVYGK